MAPAIPSDNISLIKRIIDLYRSGKSLRATARLSCSAERLVKRHLQEAGEYQNPVSRRLYVASLRPHATYFDKIDHPDKAYWLGLLYADGNVQTHQVRLALKASDRRLVELFAKTFGSSVLQYSSTHVGFRREGIALSTICNMYLSKKVQSIGLIKRKSSEAKGELLKNIPLEYRADFSRGYFDGNGSVFRKGLLACGLKKPALDWSAPQGTLAGLRSWILEAIPGLLEMRSEKLKAKLLSVTENKQVTGCQLSRMGISGYRSVVPIMEWMYSRPGPALKRKQKQLAILKSEEKQYARSRVNEIREKLKALFTLQDDWDGRQSPRPNRDSLDVISRLIRNGLPPSAKEIRVTPDVEGGVALYFFGGELMSGGGWRYQTGILSSNDGEVMLYLRDRMNIRAQFQDIEDSDEALSKAVECIQNFLS